MNSNLSIEMAGPMSRPELWDEIAVLHKREIADGFLSTLNQKFLARLYAAVVRCNEAFLLVATQGDTRKVVGFICGATDTSRVLRGCLWRSGFRLMVPLLPRLFSWQIATRALETLRYAGNGGSAVFPRAEILNFCVAGNLQGLGIGRSLFAALAAEFKQRGIGSIKIVTGESQISAQGFYDSVRATRVGDVQVHEGTHSVAFIYDIS